MPWVEVFWTEENIERLAEHDVSVEDAERIIHAPESVEISRSSGRTIAFGDAADGRELVVVYEMLDDLTAYPITAYEV